MTSQIKVTVPLDSACQTASRLIHHAFNLYDCDLLNGHIELSITQRTQVIIQAYEQHKHALYDQAEWVI
jgi:hypothetical protein